MILNLIKDLECLEQTTYDEAFELQLCGFVPRTRDRQFVYFKKSEELLLKLKEIRGRHENRN